MKRFRMGGMLWSVCLMLLGGARCHAQTMCTNTYDVTGTEATGRAATISFPLRKTNYDYGESRRKKETSDQAVFMGPSCELLGNASVRQNCAGFVLDKLWNIGKYNTDAALILRMAQTFGKRAGLRLNPRTRTWDEDPSSVQAGDIVVYGDAVHVAVVVSVGREGVIIESKDNEGAYFRFSDGFQSDGAKSRWGERAFWRLDAGRSLSHRMRSADNNCPLPAYALRCPAALTVRDPAQVPRADIQAMEKQIRDQRGTLPDGMEWIAGWMADVKSSDADNGGSGKAGDPRRITRTYRATVYCEEERPGGAFGLVECKTASCTQAIAVESAAARTQRFDNPMYQGMLLDVCLTFGNGCGQPAADAFCRWKGFSRSESSEQRLVGLSAPTKIISDGSVCRADYCTAFAYIVCRSGP
jgi:hypothetical protein